MYSSLLAYTSPLVGTYLRLTLLLWSTNIKALEVNSFLQISIVEISGLEPELREPKSLVLPLHHISISSRSGRIRTLGGIYLGGFGDRCLKPLGHRPIFIISILSKPGTIDWIWTNDPQDMNLLLLPTELHQYLEQSKGIEPSLFLLGREMPYH